MLVQDLVLLLERKELLTFLVKAQVVYTYLRKRIELRRLLLCMANVHDLLKYKRPRVELVQHC